ncbi:HAD-IIA family hydrolase [Litorilinea aerophila]|uniref:HAD family hydrolase n=1 Tax=Litorilinea aerophila TaxID=1204385 RepID=A0A540VMM5_9CHLR|nr:HAD-IIA family hydrolase [Litorilinea aerophila]MCC9074723.1 HAD-IIA family hydrolase [Litorilinea aerophila]GIV75900.1 MAG: acid sugar phosphatase [Litorilinea sp.]
MPPYKNVLMDMDGVLVKGRTAIPGAGDFIAHLNETGIPYLVLTNNPLYTPRDLAHRLHTAGLEVPAERIFTSAMATARFLHAQRPRGKAFVIGESGLTQALHDIEYVLTDYEPDYVVLGETHSYNLNHITKAIRLILDGARFVATNPDPAGPSEQGIVPACGAMAALIEKVTGVSPFFIGKPNPLMMRTALNYLGAHSEETVMIGDRMDTDIVAGLSSGMDTILVLTGVTQREDVDRFPYQPSRVVASIAGVDLAAFQGA